MDGCKTITSLLPYQLIDQPSHCYSARPKDDEPVRARKLDGQGSKPQSSERNHGHCRREWDPANNNPFVRGICAITHSILALYPINMSNVRANRTSSEAFARKY
jgi:hypothetical protein